MCSRVRGGKGRQAEGLMAEWGETGWDQWSSTLLDSEFCVSSCGPAEGIFAKFYTMPLHEVSLLNSSHR